MSAPGDDATDPFAGPSEPPPTGTKWQSQTIEGDCGRAYRSWVLVDEVCGGTDDPHYTDAFRTPMFRDGALVGSMLYAVDGTTLWAIDAADPTAMHRQAIGTGVGAPIAIAAFGSLLLLAAGDDGLIALDVSQPALPLELARLSLGGPGLDVHVDGDRAYVAAGAAGVEVIDLSQSPPSLIATLTAPGYAAGAVARGGVVYVAACGAFAAIEAASGQLLGQTWLADAVRDDVLVAPARDVAVVDDVAFVAAGRYGAVSIDVSDPTAPKVIGNCSVAEDGFYGSGVRSYGSRLYLAAGEWGILPIDASDPAAACAALTTPILPSLPSDDEVCSADPPWKVLPWQQTWTPPPPGKDPVQVLPTADLVYAFGDARRVGFRAIDVHATSDASLPTIGRYAEPHLVRGVAAKNGKVLVVGPAGGLFARDDAALLVATGSNVPDIAKTISGALLDDGRWAVTTSEQDLYVEGIAAPFPIYETIYEHGLATRGSYVAAATSNGAFVIDADAQTSAWLDSGATAALPAAILGTGAGFVLAAPEWVNAIAVDSSGPTALAPHGAFDADQILDLRAWLKGLPRRVLTTNDAGVVEIATLGSRGRLVLHGTTTETVDLPPGVYLDAASLLDRVYVVEADRGTFRSQLLTIALAPSGPEIVHIDAFTGVATGVAIDGDRIYVADANRGVRVYEPGSGGPSLLGVVDLEASP